MLNIWMLISLLAFQHSDSPIDARLLRLADTMTGFYTSTAQAESDANFFDIHLHKIRIWPNRSDAIWLYVEQAAAARLQQPYRQRIYRLTLLPDDRFESKVYEFADPLTFAGAYREPTRFSILSPKHLTPRNGCSVYLTYDAQVHRYHGRTPGKRCLSSHRGASYATSENELFNDRILTWDRGWDDQDQHVWGSENGGYIFRKQ